jgi:hypothetical protein
VNQWSERDSATRVSTSFSPKLLNIPLGPFKIFRKFAEISAAQGAPPLLLTPVAKGKNLQSEKVNL